MIANWFIPVLHFIAGFLYALKKNILSGAKAFARQCGRSISLLHQALCHIHSAPVCFVAAHKGTRTGHRVVRGEATAGQGDYFFAGVTTGFVI